MKKKTAKRSRSLLPRKILVQVDTTVDRWPALARAIALANATGAALRLVDVESEFPEPFKARAEGFDRMLRTAMDGQLAEAAKRANRAGVKTTTKVLSGDQATALVREVVASKAGLLMRSHAATSEAPHPVGPTDHHLLRRCPCPVWLVTPPHQEGEKRIVAAIDPDPKNKVRDDLSRRVLETAAEVAGTAGAELLIVNAWTAYGHQVIASHATPEELENYVEACEAHAQERVEALLARVEPPKSSSTHFLRGNPEQVLPEFVASRHASLIVIGTVARAGLAGLVMGNTAERILRNVSCSVLALKPSGFAKAMLEKH